MLDPSLELPRQPFDLSGRLILVTGASSGIGRATAVLLSRLGARLILVARNEQRLLETLRSLDGQGHRIEPFDLTAAEMIPAWLRNLAISEGPIHGLVHSAGIHKLRPIRVLSPEAVEELLRIDVVAGLALARGFSQKAVAAPGASLVFLSSVVAFTGQSGHSAYAASKGAVVSMTRALSVEFAPQKIRVNCVAPGLVSTEMGKELLDTLLPAQADALRAEHLLGIGAPVDIANAIAFLLAETGRWITGTVLVVDGGYTAH
jgi:NAD(P)-dependent dehydrogenase (short-subunit alcohol dehydrogenase family)